MEKTHTELGPSPRLMALRSSFGSKVLKPPPTAELSLIIGDCIHNVRSALDNLAFELTLAYKGAPLPSSVETSSQFPIQAKKNSTEFDRRL